ncbi:MAG TPA: hypothetical protein VFB69_03475 [Candidatus Dormibacteraeota bacterium]|nr:hypothetical protein [Candidatus Dormibacteraeota bacterium]
MTWLDMADVFVPSVVLVSIGYRAFLIAGFALWRPALLLPVTIVLVGTFLYRMFHVGRAAWAVRRILTWCVGADGTVVAVPRRGKVTVSVGGQMFSAIEISRNPNRPKVGDRIGIGIIRNAGSEVMYLG